MDGLLLLETTSKLQLFNFLVPQETLTTIMPIKSKDLFPTQLNLSLNQNQVLNVLQTANGDVNSSTKLIILELNTEFQFYHGTLIWKQLEWKFPKIGLMETESVMLN